MFFPLSAFKEVLRMFLMLREELGISREAEFITVYANRESEDRNTLILLQNVVDAFKLVKDERPLTEMLIVSPDLRKAKVRDEEPSKENARTNGEERGIRRGQLENCWRTRR